MTQARSTWLPFLAVVPAVLLVVQVHFTCGLVYSLDDPYIHLALARQIPAADRSTQAGKWEKSRFMGVEVSGKVLGIIGCGNIGAIVADRAHGLRMKVIAFDPFLSPEERFTSVRAMAAKLEAEGAGYDLASHRASPPGFRIWAGATVERSDVEALLPWLDWAWEQQRDAAKAA